MLNFNNKTINRAFTSRIDTRSLFSVSDINLDYDLKLGTTVYPPNTTLKKVLNRLSTEVTTLINSSGPMDTIYTADGNITVERFVGLEAGSGILNFYESLGGTPIVGISPEETNIAMLSSDFTTIKASLNFSSSSERVTFSDSRTTKKGIEYTADYSADIMANDRSIPDVGTVNQLIAAGSGIYGGDGTVPANTIATLDGNFRFADETGLNYIAAIGTTDYTLTMQSQGDSSDYQQRVTVDLNYATLESYNSVTGSQNLIAANVNQIQLYSNDGAGVAVSLLVSASGINCDDTNASPYGITYQNDYSATILTNERSIPDVSTIKQMDGYRPYKVYVALLSQTGTNNPVATVLENTLEEVPVWTRLASPGNYTVTTTGDVFVTNKTYSNVTLSDHFYAVNSEVLIVLKTFGADQNSLSLNVTDETLTEVDGWNAQIEIRVYP